MIAIAAFFTLAIYNTLDPKRSYKCRICNHTQIIHATLSTPAVMTFWIMGTGFAIALLLNIVLMVTARLR